MRGTRPCRILPLALALTCALATSAQNVGISTNGVAPAADALLDINAASLAANAKRGLLIPRMTEAQRLAIPVTVADNALLVYQTDVGAALDTTNARGLWYYDAPSTAWRHLSVANHAWSLKGNAITAAPNQYVGTASNTLPNRNFVIRTGAAPANPALQMGWNVMAHQQGFVGLGTAAPATERLEVEGAIRFATNSPNTNPAAPRQGTIRYGTIDGNAPTNASANPNNLKWHWGTLDTLQNIYWGRLENAETYVTPAKPFARDTVQCQNQFGDAYVGQLSAIPVTQTTNTPANIYSPFPTNYDPTRKPIFRVQYLYRNSELVKAGLCFPATINAFSFFCLDQDTLGDGGSSLASLLNGDIRGGAAVEPTWVPQGTAPYFGGTHPNMDDNIRTQAPVRGTIFNLTPAPGWITFTLTTPITLAAGQHLIIDIAWHRNLSAGRGPRVELMDLDFDCTKWVFNGSSGSPAADYLLIDDNPFYPATGSTTGAHKKRPVTRFTATVATPISFERYANYLQYDGGVMIGSPAWAAANFKGPGTVAAENGVFDGGLKLSDHVFDRYFDGDAAATPGSKHFYVGLPQLHDQLQSSRHLPNMPSRQQWETSGGASLGTLATGLWETVEEQALYITQLEQDLSSLEELSFGQLLSAEQAAALIGEVNNSRRLTPPQKAHLIEAIRRKASPNTPTR
ncbi:MAG TPA: hypothetical protein PLV70_11520 [Flavobacteriales bacterium]|nr:hypothetical protein [Flavobacteriales bacterium]